MQPTSVLRVAKAASNVVAVNKKYTVQSYGIWEIIRRVFSVDPNRSTGVPLNAQFRYPQPGALAPQTYDDPVTLPASDIADNPYWKRDTRRNYPRSSTFKQADVVGLLSVGSKSSPKDGALLAGEAGTQQLVQLKETAEERGLAAFYKDEGKVPTGVLGPNGLPPTPCSLNPSVKYEISSEQAYPSVYPCRSFI